jgi:Peptidase M15
MKYEKLSAFISIVLCSVFGVCSISEAKTITKENTDRALQKSIQKQGMASIPGVGKVYLDAPIYPGSNFTWREATKGGTRIPADIIFDGTLYPAARIAQNIIDFAEVLDEIRAEFGDRPIAINSWLRLPEGNRQAGGKPKSLHLLGLAADIRIQGISPKFVYARLAAYWMGGLGDDGAYTHVDVRDWLEWNLARWKYRI